MKEKSTEDILNELLAQVKPRTAQLFTLPSNGLFSGGVKAVEIKPMTWEDQKFLAATANNGENIMQTIASRCVTNLPIDVLPTIDSLFILMKVRELTFGPNYNLDIQCPKCSKENNVEIDISELQINYVNKEDLVDDHHLKVILPESKLEVVFRFPKLTELHYLEGNEQDNLWRFVRSINGYEDKAIVAKVIKKLNLIDMMELNFAVTGTKYGVDLRVNLNCNKCKQTSVVTLPLTQGFFSVS